jgi:hypothetical protein
MFFHSGGRTWVKCRSDSCAFNFLYDLCLLAAVEPKRLRDLHLELKVAKKEFS